MYRVLMPIDTSVDRAAAQANAIASLPGTDDSIEVTVLRVFESEEQAEGTLIEQLAPGKRVIESLSGQPAVASVETERRWGDIAEIILGEADARDVDAIVLGGRKRSKMGSLLFGSVSTDVLLNADCPVTITGEVAEVQREPYPHRVERPSDSTKFKGDRDDPVM